MIQSFYDLPSKPRRPAIPVPPNWDLHTRPLSPLYPHPLDDQISLSTSTPDRLSFRWCLCSPLTGSPAAPKSLCITQVYVQREKLGHHRGACACLGASLEMLLMGVLLKTHKHKLLQHHTAIAHCIINWPQLQAVPQYRTWKLLTVRSPSLLLQLTQVQHQEPGNCCSGSQLHTAHYLCSAEVPTQSFQPDHQATLKIASSQNQLLALASPPSKYRGELYCLLQTKGEFTPPSIYKLLIHSSQAQILFR